MLLWFVWQRREAFCYVRRQFVTASYNSENNFKIAININVNEVKSTNEYKNYGERFSLSFDEWEPASNNHCMNYVLRDVKNERF